MRKSRAAVLAVAAAVLLLATAVLWRNGTPAGTALFPADSSVLLVTIDTLRPDALGFVAGRNDTPTIDALARSGVRFTNAVAPVPLTLPSHTTMMTGLLPVHHGVHVNGEVLASEVPTLAEQFQQHGWATAAFVSATVLKPEFGLARGFDVYDDSTTLHEKRLLQRRATQTFGAAADWIRKQDGKRWFVWVHVYDAHTPYDPPRTFWQPGGERAAYDGAVSYIDNALAPLLETAKQATGDRLLTLLTADHGEAFGEHGEVEHGIFIYDTTMRVPMIFSYPGVLEAASPSFVPRHVDLAPTLVHGFGWKPPLAFDGVNLIPGLRGEPLIVPPAHIESEYPWTAFGWAPLHGVIDGSWKRIAAPTDELYALDHDAGESTNLFASQPEQAARMTAAIDRMQLEEPIAKVVETGSAETIARLQSLGYVGAGNSSVKAPEGRPDPKATTRLRILLRDAEVAARANQTDVAERLYREVLAEEPDNRFARSRMASIALESGKPAEAIEHAKAVLALAPNEADAHFVIADALTRQKSYRDAIPYWMEAARLMPTRIEAWSNLGSAALWTGDTGRAISAYQEALKLAPEEPALLGNLGEAQRAAGQKAEALVSLFAAAKHEGVGSRRAARIGLLLSDLGRDAEALDWLQRANAGEDDYREAQLRRIRYQLGSDPAEARRQLAAACRADREVKALVAASGLDSIADACRTNS